MTDPRGQESYHRRHAYHDALQCPTAERSAQGHQNPRRQRRGIEVPRPQAVRRCCRTADEWHVVHGMAELAASPRERRRAAVSSYGNKEIRTRESARSALFVGVDDSLRGRLQPFRVAQRSADAGRAPIATPRSCILNPIQDLYFARHNSTLLTGIGYHRLPPRRGPLASVNSLTTAP
jgi:hypothetical protein